MSKQWHVQQSTAEQLYEQTPDETVQLIWTDPPFGTGQLQVGSAHSYQDGTVADTLALTDQLGASAVEITTRRLEGGGACCEHSKCPGGSICCCQEGGGE